MGCRCVVGITATDYPGSGERSSTPGPRLWQLLNGSDRDRLGELADWLLRERRWEAARGFELTDEVRTVVAAHAVLPILGLDETWYDGVGAIIVRDGSMTQRHTAGPGAGHVRTLAPGSRRRVAPRRRTADGVMASGAARGGQPAVRT